MKTTFRLVVSLTLLVGLGLWLWAQDVDAPRSGKVLLLRSERALEGDIEKVGAQYHVRRGSGEMLVAAEQAVRLCADWDDAYRYLRGRANLNDADERLRLARWCRLHRLDRLALEEARVVLEMRPGQPEARQMVALLERHQTGSPPAQPTTAPPPLALGPVPEVDLDPESLIQFKTRIQPILMNACVSCHGGPQAGAFRLYRVSEGGQHGSTQRNLSAVLAQVNLEQVAVSPLLVKAVSPHGGTSQRPLVSKEGPPFRMLQTWLEQTAANNPHLRAHKAAVGQVPPARTAAVVPAVATSPAIVSRPLTRVEGGGPSPGTEVQPAVHTTDPFDPGVFNAQNPLQK
jgi:hypothetical protein